MNELIPVNELPQSPHDVSAWNDVIASSVFLPRVQLFGGNSDATKEGKIPIGHYGLVRGKDQISDLTTELVVLPVAWRFKAMRFSEGSVVSIFNPANPEFNRIRSDSEEPNSGAMFGVEFLVWLPSESLYGTLFLNNKTSRKEAPTLKALIGQAATLKVALVSKGKYKWHAPVAVKCSTPIVVLPDFEDVKVEAGRFVNAKDSVMKEEATEEEVASVERDR